jgi:hypothetical protein
MEIFFTAAERAFNGNIAHVVVGGGSECSCSHVHSPRNNEHVCGAC